ncbi:MAG: Lacal_2735 family protein [Bacteroidia bacterium]|nr:Lacal_2735 family protein [Bacteroidia bacterium]NNF32195.1 Lacal_2735 family protein [Flavobacteriaceae bacterium]MBT8276658.1 Lacal_2735 family protein [Bacteroidia bacterium]NNJ82119.1 Lacal_2735 family protein [Flavobacteriaceae bacterium]NNK55116.1 Lacal_2735 family protein [Flavobacteriaceae bacterium]
MFGIFKSKSERDKLQKRYEKLMSEAHQLSQTNRKAGDAKYQEAEQVMLQLEKLK